MRPFRTAVLIIGFFLPFVIHAEPFGSTELTVFDTDFLAAPPGPPAGPPSEVPVPGWVVMVPDEVPVPRVVPPIPLSELSS